MNAQGAGSEHDHECGPDTCGFATFEERMAIRDEVEPTIPDPPPFVGDGTAETQDSAKARVVMIATEAESRGLQVDVSERWDAMLEELKLARRGLEHAYSALCDDTLGPAVSLDAVEAARAVLAQALVDCYAVGS